MEQSKKDLATPAGQDALMGYLARCLEIIQAELPPELQPMILLVHKDDIRTCTAVGHPTRRRAIAALRFLERNRKHTEVAVNRSGVIMTASDHPAAGESVN